VIGGRTFPVDPLAAIDSGRYNRVPTIIGNTRNEFSFVKLGNPNMTAEELRAAVAERYPDDDEAILAEYDGAYPTPADTFSAIVNDPGICGIHDLAGRLSRSTRVWHYEFDDQDPPPEIGIDIDLGAYHSSELQYLFGFSRSDGTAKYQRGLDPAEQRLAGEMIWRWGRFAKRGDPGRGWPRFTLERPLVLRFQPGGSAVVTSYEADHRCGFWRALGVPLEFQL
jgi:para-nitrobenzyl esterase